MPIDYDSSREALFHPESRATVFGDGPPPERVALAVEAARLAYVHAEKGGADLARLGTDLAKAGFGAPEVFNDDATDSQGYGTVRAADGLALLAFRGTQAEKFKDLLSDLNALPVAWPGVGGKVHKGFAAAATALQGPVQAWMTKTASTRQHLLVCGHSLGAAIATLLAPPLRANTLVTIGSPRVGDAAFVAAFGAAGIACTRVVDFKDIVARVPPTGFGYRHLGGGVLVDADGRLVPNPPASDVDRDADATDLALASGAALPFVALPRQLSDHAPVNYLRAFWR